MGVDYFGARFYENAMARFYSPDWSASPEAVPYAKLGNPQSLNLYTYVRDNPMSYTDADGHYLINGVDQQFSMQDTLASLQSLNGASLATVVVDAGMQAAIADLAQQQNANSSSNGHSFWGHVSNLLHGHSWNYGMRESVTVRILPAGPIPGITALTDAAGLISTATKNTPLGVASAVGSVANDHSAQNVTTNAVGLIPGLGWQTGIMGAFIDFFDYGIHNSTPGPQKVGGDPTGPGELQPTLPTQDGGCEAAGLPSC
jgi:RHS repeat-associated protein